MLRSLVLVVALGLLAPASAAAAGDERCAPPVTGGGQAALVVVLMDGIGSQEPQSGTSNPLTVGNWCPAQADGSERRLPAGLDAGFRTWAGLATDDGTKPQTTTCRPEGGLTGDACLVARMADAGAVLLPYSYAGSTLRRTADGGTRFTFAGYTPQDTHQDPAVSIRRLDEMVSSISEAWPVARIVIVAHSYGGTVASGWWQEHARSLGAVRHVFTLDSPVNGIEQCAATAVIFSRSVSDELCRRWNGRDALDRELLALDDPQTLTTIGTPGDPTYDPPITAERGPQASGGGQLRPQVLYRCPDAGADPRSACIAAPPSVVNRSAECSGRGPGVFGRTGHFAVIGCPQTTQTIVPALSTGVGVASGAGRRAVERPRALRTGRVLVRDVVWSSFGGVEARGRGTVRGARRSIVLTTARPCEAERRLTYRRIRVQGLAVVKRTCARVSPRPRSAGARRGAPVRRPRA